MLCVNRRTMISGNMFLLPIARMLKLRRSSEILSIIEFLFEPVIHRVQFGSPSSPDYGR